MIYWEKKRELSRDREENMTRNRTQLKVILAALFVTAALAGLLAAGWLRRPGAEPAAPTELTEETTLPAEEITEATDPPGPTEPDLTGIPDSLLELMEKNPETVDFVLNYPHRVEQTVDISGLSREEVPLFIQWDQRWGYHIYGTDVLALTGCGPTSMAMVGYYLTGDERFTPDQMAEFCLENDYYAWGKGTTWTLFSQGVKKLGLKSEELPLFEPTMISHLEKGHPVVISVGPGDFTERGHFIVAVGYEDGMFRINDPNSVIRSEMLWSYDTLAPQIRNLWAVWKD